MNIEERINEFTKNKILKNYQGKWLIDNNILCLEIIENGSDFLYEIGEFAIVDSPETFLEQLEVDYLKDKHVLYIKNSFYSHSADHDNFDIVFFINRYFTQFNSKMINLLIDLNLIKNIDCLSLEDNYWTEYHYNIINDRNDHTINICNIASTKGNIAYNDSYNFHILTGENNIIDDDVFLKSLNKCFLNNFDAEINKENFKEVVKYVLLSIDCGEY